MPDLYLIRHPFPQRRSHYEPAIGYYDTRSADYVARWEHDQWTRMRATAVGWSLWEGDAFDSFKLLGDRLAWYTRTFTRSRPRLRHYLFCEASQDPAFDARRFANWLHTCNAWGFFDHPMMLQENGLPVVHCYGGSNAGAKLWFELVNGEALFRLESGIAISLGLPNFTGLNKNVPGSTITTYRGAGSNGSHRSNVIVDSVYHEMFLSPGFHYYGAGEHPFLPEITPAQIAEHIAYARQYGARRIVMPWLEPTEGSVSAPTKQRSNYIVEAVRKALA